MITQILSLSCRNPWHNFLLHPEYKTSPCNDLNFLESDFVSSPLLYTWFHPLQVFLLLTCSTTWSFPYVRRKCQANDIGYLLLVTCFSSLPLQSPYLLQVASSERSNLTIVSHPSVQNLWQPLRVCSAFFIHAYYHIIYIDIDIHNMYIMCIYTYYVY